MRIVCDSCGTKYSIPDDRVRNKPFKIRCKKCSYTIVVDSAEAPDASSDAVWYVVINGEQVGPVATRDVDEYFYSRQVDLETFIWREGFPDWIQLSAAAEFAHLLNAGAPAEAAAVGAAAVAASEGEDAATRQVSLDEIYKTPLGASGSAAAPPEDENESTRIVSMEGVGSEPAASPATGANGAGYGAFADPSPAPGGGFDHFGEFGGGAQLESRVSSDDDGGLFGAAGLSDLGAASAPAPSASKGPRVTANELVGARSENSVLFSLSNLQAIGAPKSSDKDLPTTEGSGLIDIKALAASQAAAPSDNRPSFGGGGGGDIFDGSVIPVPAMMPMGTRKSNTGLIIGISAGAVVLLALFSIVIILLVSGEEEQQPQAAKSNAGETEEKVDAPDLGVGAGQPGQVVAQNMGGQAAGQPGQTAATDGGAGTAAGTGQTGDAGQAAGDGGTPAGADGDQPPEDGGEQTAAADAATDEDKATRRRGSRRSRSSTEEKPAEPPAETKPTRTERKPVEEESSNGGSDGCLTKADVQNTIRKEFGKIRTCSRGAEVTGKLLVQFTIKADGRVADVSEDSPEFKGTKVGACVVKVVSAMRFPKGCKDTSIKYPFAIN